MWHRTWNKEHHTFVHLLSIIYSIFPLCSFILEKPNDITNLLVFLLKRDDLSIPLSGLILISVIHLVGSLHHIYWWNWCCWVNPKAVGRSYKKNTASTTCWNGWFWTEWGKHTQRCTFCLISVYLLSHLLNFFTGNYFDGCNKLAWYTWSCFDKTW